MEKLVKPKIRQKKPKDSIKQKFPTHHPIPKTKLKFPSDSQESFTLPPQKTRIIKNHPKSERKLPTNYGSKKHN